VAGPQTPLPWRCTRSRRTTQRSSRSLVNTWGAVRYSTRRCPGGTLSPQQMHLDVTVDDLEDAVPRHRPVPASGPTHLTLLRRRARSARPQPGVAWGSLLVVLHFSHSPTSVRSRRPPARRRRHGPRCGVGSFSSTAGAGAFPVNNMVSPMVRRLLLLRSVWYCTHRDPVERRHPRGHLDRYSVDSAIWMGRFGWIRLLR
jgi:hypothetical protein